VASIIDCTTIIDEHGKKKVNNSSSYYLVFLVSVCAVHAAPGKIISASALSLGRL